MGRGVTRAAHGYLSSEAEGDTLMTYRNAARLTVLMLGLFYVVLAIWGFAQISDETNVGGDLRGGNPSDLLWGVFGVSTVLNFIHFLLGVFTVVAAVTLMKSAWITWYVAIGLGLVVAYGLLPIGSDPLNINWADNWLHLVSAVVMVGAALVPARTPARIW
jgi:hypothetical protein